MINRYNRRQRKMAAGIPSKPKGQPKRRPLRGEKEYKKEIARLPMENQLLRIFLKYWLLSYIRRHRKWVQLGQQVHKYENLLNWQFHADRPNSK